MLNLPRAYRGPFCTDAGLIRSRLVFSDPAAKKVVVKYQRRSGVEGYLFFLLAL